MARKKPNTFQTLKEDEVKHINRSFTDVYQVKMEAIEHSDSGIAKNLTYQTMETGKYDLNAEDAISQVLQFAGTWASKKENILYVNAEVVGPFGMHATWKDITATGYTVNMGLMKNTGPPSNNSIITNITTGTIQFYYTVITSEP